MEDSNLSEINDDFVILPSQEESQMVEMKDAVANLPALKLDSDGEDKMQASIETEDGDNVLTPAEHIGSLHLSQCPMIVPETEDDTDSMVPPSPAAYGRTPIIIPNSPTQLEEGMEDETETDYDVTIMNTFTDRPKGAHTPGESSGGRQQNSHTSPIEDDMEEKKQSMEVSTRDFQAGLDQPTLVDSESLEPLHLHLTESTQASHISAKVDIAIDISSSSESLNNKTIAANTTDREENEKGDEDVIIIQDNVDDSQNLRLWMTPSQDGRINSQTSDLHGNKLNKKVRSRRMSREDALIADINAHPLVVWKDLSDAEGKLIEGIKPLSPKKFVDFHLSIPKDTPTEPPEVKIPSDYSPPGTSPGDNEHSDWTDKQDEGHKAGTDTSLIDLDEEVSIRRALTIKMMNSDSEPCSQTVFKLERPAIVGETEEATNDTEDIFARAKIPNPRRIQEDSEDLEGDVVPSLSTNYDASEKMFVAKKLSPTITSSPMVEMATQTPDKDLEVSDSVVLKVTQYLQSGLAQPRSRASSVCTDWSGSHHSEGSEKGDTIMKSPISPRKDNMLGKKPRTPMLQRSYSEKHKSPEEVKQIIQTYSSIISKSKRRRMLSGESKHSEDCPSTPQRPNPAGESPVISKTIQPRRLSVQSLPADLSVVDNKDISTVPGKPDSQISGISETTGTGHFIPTTCPSRPKEYKAKKFIDMEVDQQTSYSVNESPKKDMFDDSDQGVVSQLTMENNPPITQHQTSVHEFGEGDTSVIVTNTVLTTANQTCVKQTHLTTKESRTVLSRDIHISNKPETLPLTSGHDDLSHVISQSHVTPSSQSEERAENTSSKGLSPRVGLTNISHLLENHKPMVIEKKISIRRRLSRRKQKSIKSSSKRKAFLKTSPSSQSSSGHFTNSTQRFQTQNQDLFTFHGSQSQILSQQEMTKTSDSFTPKRKLIHRKSGLKKQRVSTETLKKHVSYISSTQQSDVAMTTSSGSSSIPSTISHRSQCLEPVTSPSSSSSRQSVAEEITTRLSGKRLSVDQSLPDTIPLHHGEEDNYQKVTIVTETVEKLFREITTVRKVVGEDGTILESSQEVKKLDPVTVEENTHKRIQFIYIPSPSRSGTSMTSGDLGDISSSMSKSSVSSGSLGSKVSLSSSASLDHVTHNVTGNKSTSDTRIIIKKSVDLASTQQSTTSISTENQSKLQPQPLSMEDQSKTQARSMMMENQSKTKPLSISTENQSKTKPPSISTGNQSKPQTPTISSNQSKPGTQPVTMEDKSKSFTPGVTVTNQTGSVTPAIPSTSAVISDHETSDVLTPLGSTINKTGSHLHERTSSMESPYVSDNMLSSNNDKGIHDTRYAGTQGHHARSGTGDEDDTRSVTHGVDDPRHRHTSGEIPYQVQSVSSSSVSDCGDSLISSTGVIGSRVIAKWKDGFFYPGTLKSTVDRYSKCQVCFDDGDKWSVKVQDILLVERLPTGQSVMVLTDEGDFECGLILQQAKDHYKVETDRGSTGRYSLSQVILSSDQAAFLIADLKTRITLQVPGHSSGPGVPVNVGDVSLDNLLDTPRRRLKESARTDNIIDVSEESGQSSRSRKRKMDVLKPQATSTPTPKGKSDGPTKRRRVERTYETSPIAVSTEVPDRDSPRKTKIGLFRKEIGPLPTKKLFKGLNLLLTHVEKSKEQLEQEKKLLKPTTLNTSTDESSQEDEAGAPFDKDHLIAQIEAGGGTVIENFTDKLIDGKKKCLLISSSYQRTIKFLQCLAVGIPCVSYMWIVDSCTRNQLLDRGSYILPTGISLEKRKLIEWKARDGVFIGMKAMVHSKDDKFVETWTNILKLSKCHVLEGVSYKDAHVIVTDRTCQDRMEKQAANRQIPIVSIEWVIQSLITGRPAPYTGHPRYRHDLAM